MATAWRFVLTNAARAKNSLECTKKNFHPTLPYYAQISWLSRQFRDKTKHEHRQFGNISGRDSFNRVHRSKLRDSCRQVAVDVAPYTVNCVDCEPVVEVFLTARLATIVLVEAAFRPRDVVAPSLPVAVLATCTSTIDRQLKPCTSRRNSNSAFPRCAAYNFLWKASRMQQEMPSSALKIIKGKPFWGRIPLGQITLQRSPRLVWRGTSPSRKTLPRLRPFGPHLLNPLHDKILHTPLLTVWFL